MVYAVIQFAVVILAVKHMMMVFTAQLVTTVQAVVVQLIMQPDIMVLAAQLPTIAATGMVAALHPHKQSAWHAVRGKLASEYAPPIYHA